MSRSAELLALDGRVALVCGGSGGIGSAVVRALLGAGASVASVDLSDRPAVEGAVAFTADLGDRGAVDGLFRDLRTRFARLDIVVHCTGIVRDAVLWKTDPEDWSVVLRTNLDSAFLVLRAAVPWLRQQSDGAVVLVSSINGERGKFGQASYAASKAGLIGLARTAARELGRFGTRVNVVAPGMIETAMTAGLSAEVRQLAAQEAVLGRVGQPDDVAQAVLFLASRMAQHITGQVLRVDGGQLIA